MATVYLSTTGSDSYTYAQAQSSSTPWLTPGKVQTSATTGDTVSVASGTYTIGAGITFTKNFTWNAVSNGDAIFDFANVNYRIEFSSATQTFNGIKFYRGKHNPSYGAIFIHVAGNTYTHTFNDCIIDTMSLNSPIANLGGVFGDNNCTGVNFVFNRCLFKEITYDTSASGTALFAFRNADPTSGVQMNYCTTYLSSTAKPIEKIFNDAASTNKPVFSGKGNAFKSEASIAVGATSCTMTYSGAYNITSFPANTGNLTSSDPLFIDATNTNYNLRQLSPLIDLVVIS